MEITWPNSGPALKANRPARLNRVPRRLRRRGLNRAAGRLPAKSASLGPAQCPLALLPMLQVELQVLRFIEDLPPLRLGLAVHRADAIVARLQQLRHKMAADESAGAGNHDPVSVHVQCSRNVV